MVRLNERDGNIWLTQNQIAELFDTSKPNISMHISKLLQENELDENSVVKYYLTTGPDGKQYSVLHYALPMIIAIGFRVRGKRGTQFRMWANSNLQEYMKKGFIMDDERLKNPDGRPDYFDEMLARIRDIRASEKRFYQKLRDLFKLSSDYNSTSGATQIFFAETQNKLLFAVTKKTAAEIIINRADIEKENMGLTNWQGSIVRKQDIYIAKNYLKADEIDTLNRLVVIFLETAELRIKNRIDITIDFWQDNVNRIIQSNDFALLPDKGTVSKDRMQKIANTRYEQFDSKRKIFEAEQADRQDEEELHQIEDKIKNRPNK